MSAQQILQYVCIDGAGDFKNLRKLFKLSFGIDLNKNPMIMLNEIITQIAQNEVGNALLHRICSLIEVVKDIQHLKYDGMIHITFNVNGTSFSGTSCPAKNSTKRRISRFAIIEPTPMRVGLNIDLNRVFYKQGYGLCSIVPGIKRAKNDKHCSIMYCCDPFWITVAHEFIHMERYLTEIVNDYVSKKIYNNKQIVHNEVNEDTIHKFECKLKMLSKYCNYDIDVFNKLPNLFHFNVNDLIEYYKFLIDDNRLHARYSKNKSLNAWHDVKSMIEMFPELNARKTKRNSLNFFSSVEERETVVGSRCSELTIRLAEWKKGNIVPIRYLYQHEDTFFLEEKSVILQIINNARISIGMSGSGNNGEFLASDLNERIYSKEYLSNFDFSNVSCIVTEELLPDSINP